MDVKATFVMDEKTKFRAGLVEVRMESVEDA